MYLDTTRDNGDFSLKTSVISSSIEEFFLCRILSQNLLLRLSSGVNCITLCNVLTFWRKKTNKQMAPDQNMLQILSCF